MTTHDSVSFGLRLRAAREAADLTQEQVAERLGVTQSAVQKWESGAAWPRGPHRLSDLADLYDVDLNTLLGKPAA